MSSKANFYGKINAAQNILTIVLSSFLGFIGFSGNEKIQKYLSFFVCIDVEMIGFFYNLLIFGLFVVATLHLVFRFEKRQNAAEQAIVNLTQLINYIEDLLSREDRNLISLGENDLSIVYEKYSSILQIIPANTNEEYLKAKLEISQKEIDNSTSLSVVKASAIFDSKMQRKIIEMLIERSHDTKRILQSIRNTNYSLYLAGGILRNLVWDYLHDYKSNTQIDDVDIVYYDIANISKEQDRKIEEQLKKIIPNYKWSVKNQARMHLFNKEAQYSGFEDSVSKWPETATAIAVRYNDDGGLEIVAPHGLEDLFRLIVKPTPHFFSKSDRIQTRLRAKEWLRTWPKLKLINVEP